MAFITLAERRDRDSQKTSQKKWVLQQTFANEKGLQIRSVADVRKIPKLCEALVSFVAHQDFKKSSAFHKFEHP
jgi:hypothetical protein